MQVETREKSCKNKMRGNVRWQRILNEPMNECSLHMDEIGEAFKLMMGDLNNDRVFYEGGQYL